MKKDTSNLLLSIGEIDDMWIKYAEISHNSGKRKTTYSWVLSVGCVVLLVGTLHIRRTTVDNHIDKIQVPSQLSTTFSTAGSNIDVIPSEDNIAIQEQYNPNNSYDSIISTEIVMVNEKEAIYTQVTNEEELKLLEAGVGSPLNDETDWYQLKGYDETDYLIKKDEDSLTLWKFHQWR